MTMNHIVAEQQWNFQACFFHCHLLQLSYSNGRECIKDTAHETFLNFLLHILTHNRTRHIKSNGDEVELADLFLKRHLIEQAANESIHVLRLRSTLLFLA